MYAHLPMYQRVGQKALSKKFNLETITAFCAHLNNPHQNFSSIHIAGTNGKGSSAHWIAAILQCAGYKTGLYTSPHLKNFTERIKINGHEITQEAVIQFIEKIKPFISTLNPSFFEITVAMAFNYFAMEEVDIAVIEVGLGGRLDSTNIIHPELCLITNISFDHTSILGNSLEEIAYEKVGIFKLNVPVVVSEKQMELYSILCKKAKETNSSLYFADEIINIEPLSKGYFSFLGREGKLAEKVKIGLKGNYQLKNLKGVLQSIEILKKVTMLSITSKNVCKGIENIVSLTGIKGRWQVLNNEPLEICDIAHNKVALKEIFFQLSRLKYQKLYIVFGMVSDKDVKSILQTLPHEAYYIFCAPQLSRALPAEELYYMAKKKGLQGQVEESVSNAIRIARKMAKKKDLIFIGGSTFVVAEIEAL